MNVLFVHNNFPAQFGAVAQALAREQGVRVAAIGSPTARPVPGVTVLRYDDARRADPAVVHPFARRFETECRRAEQVLYAATALRASGFVPDVVVAHPGWGETLPLREAFPTARHIVYCEFYYAAEGGDVGFDPEFPGYGLDGRVAIDMKNAATLLALAGRARGVSPTRWQRSTYPESLQPLIEVVHEGIDTTRATPDPVATVVLPDGRRLRVGDEVITFVARNLEPLRGYHVFMRSLPRVLAARPNARVLIVGADGPGYGLRPPPGTTWKARFLDEVAPRLDRERVHFLGPVAHDVFLDVLRVSSAHVYLTYPFVLSWSLLEAMSAGCLVIASDTPPLREVIDGDTGVLVPFFDVPRLADTVVEALAAPERFRPLRAAARRRVTAHYDRDRVCVPRMLRLVRGEA
ncbi:glycosyltransferase [Rhodoplanes azumiensis]|uniref:Glycosyltransferase n=1 Tax=Rhodoplanes azumiensis TaxID=1897628 RepID=A0ABW5AL62_9BRAD